MTILEDQMMLQAEEEVEMAQLSDHTEEEAEVMYHHKEVVEKEDNTTEIIKLRKIANSICDIYISDMKGLFLRSLMC